MLLLWSGGVDSTWLLYRYLTENKQVRTLSINHPQIAGRVQCKRARKRIKQALSHYSFPANELEVEVIEGAAQVQQGSGLPQLVMWLHLALLYAVDKEQLVFGFLRGGNVWAHVDKLTAICDHVTAILGKSVSLEFPLRYDTKADVIKQFKKEALDLFNLTWYCEKDKARKPCGKCTPCRTHRTALWQIEQRF